LSRGTYRLAIRVASGGGRGRQAGMNAPPPDAAEGRFISHFPETAVGRESRPSDGRFFSWLAPNAIVLSSRAFPWGVGPPKGTSIIFNPPSRPGGPDRTTLMPYGKGLERRRVRLKGIPMNDLRSEAGSAYWWMNL